ncbi:transposase [Paenibacillus profundus]|uniref:Transposase n=1 Tax=Paenibacillus profundus TaxID=1173085 RepID=A0ABS8YPB8_9BACL|nr:transposase [Paenibacillus profundus]MCE5173387.1 transposase [Paenibacillus profundus]
MPGVLHESCNQAIYGEQTGRAAYSRNGYRGLHTKYGYIKKFEVPHDRNGQFQTQGFEPYQASRMAGGSRHPDV